MFKYPIDFLWAKGGGMGRSVEKQIPAPPPPPTILGGQGVRGQAGERRIINPICNLGSSRIGEEREGKREGESEREREEEEREGKRERGQEREGRRERGRERGEKRRRERGERVLTLCRASWRCGREDS